MSDVRCGNCRHWWHARHIETARHDLHPDEHRTRRCNDCADCLDPDAAPVRERPVKVPA